MQKIGFVGDFFFDICERDGRQKKQLEGDVGWGARRIAIEFATKVLGTT